MVVSKKWKFISILVCFFILSFVSISLIPYSGISHVEAETTYAQNKAIQQRLSDLGYYNGAIDGVINWETTQAIKKFQYDYGVVQDGIVGPETARLLGINLNEQSNNDLYLLAKCVYAEARGEPYVGQVAVAAVILNRVKHPDFPNTIYGVVYQPWAFTAVYDGQIGYEPNETAYQAAQDALNGWDPTYGSIYYYNPATATSQWIFSRKVVVTIGKHVFAV
ncbi:MAG: spore cortex-lytic enzyme [Firmicutes bacterium]|nr:spore cortex-lytic enzyme [Bacillota bacterium]MDY3659273.1 spore cortex-lytic enzyme [Eubacteriales bacterium]